MPSACFNSNYQNLNTLQQKKQEDALLIECTLLIYLWAEYLQIFLNCFLQFKWVLNAFLDFAILVDDE